MSSLYFSYDPEGFLLVTKVSALANSVAVNVFVEPGTGLALTVGAPVGDGTGCGTGDGTMECIGDGEGTAGDGDGDKDGAGVNVGSADEDGKGRIVVPEQGYAPTYEPETLHAALDEAKR